MRFSISAVLLLAAGAAHAASSWSFDDASVAVASKKGGEASKEKLNRNAPLSKPVVLGAQDTIKISLTAKDNGKAKRPHQAFLLIQEPTSGLEAPFPLDVKDTGKGSVSLTQKDLPVQLLLASTPLKASIVIGSFGSAQGLVSEVFTVDVQADAAAPLPHYEKPLRYGKQPEIHHIFRADPRSPPQIISLVFVLAVAATVPALLVGWVALGANVDDLGAAIGSAPLSHAAFFGSIVAMEGVFFLYYVSWTLFQVLPVIGLVGTVTLLSGSKALGELQSRRLARK